MFATQKRPIYIRSSWAKAVFCAVIFLLGCFYSQQFNKHIRISIECVWREIFILFPRMSSLAIFSTFKLGMYHLCVAEIFSALPFYVCKTVNTGYMCMQLSYGAIQMIVCLCIDLIYIECHANIR